MLSVHIPGKYLTEQTSLPTPYTVILGHLSFSGVSFTQIAAVTPVLVVKNPPGNAGDIRDAGSILGLGRSPGGGHSNPYQYSYLENSMDRGAWRATVHGATKSQTRLSGPVHTRTHTHTHTPLEYGCSWDLQPSDLLHFFLPDVLNYLKDNFAGN